MFFVYLCYLTKVFFCAHKKSAPVTYFITRHPQVNCLTNNLQSAHCSHLPFPFFRIVPFLFLVNCLTELINKNKSSSHQSHYFPLNYSIFSKRNYSITP